MRKFVAALTCAILSACGGSGSTVEPTAPVTVAPPPVVITPPPVVVAPPPVVITPPPVAIVPPPPVVVPPVSANVTVTWVAPTTNTDGSVLIDLAGFFIRYGTDPSNLDQSVDLPAGATTYTVPGLPAGTWYFSMTSVNSAGTQSAATPQVNTTI